MKLLLAFMVGAALLSVWEVRGGPRWRTPIVIAVCLVVAVGFLSPRVV
jgi:hypothetical protein